MRLLARFVRGSTCTNNRRTAISYSPVERPSGVATPGEREGIEQSAAALGVPFHRLFLVANLDTRIARIGRRYGDASDADAAIARAQESYELGTLSWTRIDASGTPEETLARAKATLGLRPAL